MNKETLKTIGIYILFLILFIVATLGLSGYFERRTITNVTTVDGVVVIHEVKKDGS